VDVLKPEPIRGQLESPSEIGIHRSASHRVWRLLRPGGARPHAIQERKNSKFTRSYRDSGWKCFRRREG